MMAYTPLAVFPDQSVEITNTSLLNPADDGPVRVRLQLALRRRHERLIQSFRQGVHAGKNVDTCNRAQWEIHAETGS
jgi:hypothetical protein